MLHRAAGINGNGAEERGNPAFSVFHYHLKASDRPRYGSSVQASFPGAALFTILPESILCIPPPAHLLHNHQSGSLAAMSDFPSVTAPPDIHPRPILRKPPTFTPLKRRTHKKSRTGCATCKARKIKCDERHPACINCISHGVECPFLRGPPPPPPTKLNTHKTRAASTASPTSQPSPVSFDNIPTPSSFPPGTSPSPAPHDSLSLAVPSPIPLGASPSPVPPGASPSSLTQVDAPSPGPSSCLPMLELELLHNYTTQTYRTLTADPIWDFWRDDVVRLGLRCEYVMQTVLAVSALHLAFLRPDRRDEYITEGIMLHQRASRSAMRVMAAGEGLDSEQAASLFVFSMLTMFFALGSPRRSNPDGSFFIGDSGFPDWAFLFPGTKSIQQVLGDERGLHTVVAPFLRYGQERWHAQRALLQKKGVPLPSQTHSTSTQDDTDSQQQQQPRAQPILAPLHARIVNAVTDPSLLATYSFALDELEMALALAFPDRNTCPPPSSPVTTTTTNPNDPDSAPRDVLDAMVWLWRVSDTLVPLLRTEAGPAQEAVAIFAHFSVLLRHHEKSAWWLRGWGEAMLRRASEVLVGEYRGWIEWPVRAMEGLEGLLS
ncbi:hypothetical protein VTJ49DRAFT_6583 [Mycothermus thermophilus]|uniref:Zn(2)-C6 fungal-type domain-containing protein n=1 Tax=Humicola insolens TaxID=85995 RepID=A0ABR3V1M8_HUMIN